MIYFNILAAKQNQKFPFHFLSAPPTPPAELNQKGRKIFGFCPRESASVSKAQSERKIKFRVTTRSARAISSFFQNKFAQRLVFLHTETFLGCSFVMKFTSVVLGRVPCGYSSPGGRTQKLFYGVQQASTFGYNIKNDNQS
jgi:hypothetical protein